MTSSVVLMCGLPAAGKTVTASRVHAATGAQLIRSCDVFADIGIDLPAWVRRTRGFTVDVGEYETLRDTAYDEIHRRLGSALAGGAPLIVVDAVYGESAKRRAAYDVCAAWDRRPALLWCRCDDPGETARRVWARLGHEMTRENEASDLAVHRHIERLWNDPRCDGVPTATLDTVAHVFDAPPGAPFDVIARALRVGAPSAPRRDRSSRERSPGR